jgi:tetratricopeptide (TPR) repeat protein
MTEPPTLVTPPVRKNSSDSDKLARIRTLGALILSDLNNLNNLSFHAELAWAYLEAGQFDKAIERFETCYELNINNGDNIHAAKAASVMGYCFLKRSWTARNSSLNKAQDWRDGIEWKLRASRLYRKSCRINPSDSKTIKNYALNEDSIGYAYLRKANQSSENPEQAKKYWLKGMVWKEKAYALFKELSQTDPSTLENCAKTAGYIGEKYLKASKRRPWEANPEQVEQYWLEGMAWKERAYTFKEKLISDTDPSKEQDCALTADEIGQEYLDASHRLRGANPEQAEKYWLEGMAWKEKAYGSYKELSHTDSSKKQDCAKTAAQLGKEFANQRMDYYAIEWYKKALHHDPGNESVKNKYKALGIKMALEDLIQRGERSS